MNDIVRDTRTNRTRDVLKYWQHLRRNDCFTDLTVYCGTDFGCVSLHGAVLAACSPLIASLLTENNRSCPREGNVIFLPDCEKEDFVGLVKVKSQTITLLITKPNLVQIIYTYNCIPEIFT